MQTAFSILRRIFVNRFYLRNTGFFLLLFYLLFGVVDGGSLWLYHRGLMEGFLEHPGFLLLVLAAWLLYNLKCTGFMLKTWQLPEYSFLYATLGCVEKNKRRRWLLMLHAGMYLPVLIYAGIAAVVAFSHMWWGRGSIILIFNGMMCLLPVWLYEKKLQKADTAFFTGKLQQWLDRRFTKPVSLYYLFELLNRFPQRWLSVKLISALVLLLTFSLTGNASTDIRGVFIGVLLSVLLHTQLLFGHRIFEDQYLSFLRQLPFSLIRRYLQLLLTNIWLLLPELLLLAGRTWPMAGVGNTALIILAGISLLQLFRSLLYFPRLDPDKHIRWILGIAFAALFLVLGNYGWAMTVGVQLAALLIFCRRYGKYEPLPAVQ